MTHIAFEDYAADEWGGVGVWQKAYGGQGSGDEEAGGLASGYAAVAVAEPHRCCRVDGCGVDGFFGQQAHLDAGQRNDELHVARRCGAGVVVAGNGQWQAAVNVNLTGLFLCAQAAVKPMKKQNHGVIINICSTYGLAGPDQRIYEKEGQDPNNRQYKPVYYSVTKAGVLGLTRYLATYYAGTGIRANALTPGGVFNNNDDEFVTRYSYRAVLGRMAHQDEMNGAILFLASDASTYMTGANLVVDGGWTAW